MPKILGVNFGCEFGGGGGLNPGKIKPKNCGKKIAIKIR